MTIKRSIQHLIRIYRSLRQDFSFTPPYIKEIRNSLNERVPSAFDKAIFNFTIDFELVWGNGMVDGQEHSKERRIQAAMAQSENFKPFVDLVKELDIPLSWAVVGKLADAEVTPGPRNQFKPSWAKRSWYDSEYKKLDPKLWRGEDYLNYIEKNLPDHEIKSHGFGHIDYIDEATTEDVARWDMRKGIELLRARGHKVNGFVFPCNHHAHLKLLKENEVDIIRGQNHQWKTLILSEIK